MKTRYVYQFKEIFTSNHLVSTDNPFFMTGELPYIVRRVYNVSDTPAEWLARFMENFPYFEYKQGNWALKDNAVELMKVLLPKYWKSVCLALDSEDELTEKTKEFFNEFLNIMTSHWDYYDTLLSYYSEDKANLLRQVQSTTSISSVRNTTDGGTSSTNTSSNGTTGGTDTLTLNTKEETDNTHNNTGKDTKETTYASGVSNGRSTTGSVEAISTLKDTPQIMLTDTDDYNSNRTDTSTDTSETVSESSSKSGKDTDETTYASGFTDDNEVKRTGTETTTHSGTTGSQEASTTTDSRNHSDAYSDTHTTNDDRDTLMARIAEIQENYKSLIMEYAMKFKDLFWSVMNYEE